MTQKAARFHSPGEKSGLSKGLWRQITVLETRVAELETLRCPYGQAIRDRCAAGRVPDPPTH
jgi:hypothetical protein